jgi:hypothetical protein
MRIAILLLSGLLTAGAPACSKPSSSKGEGKGGGASGGAASAEAAARGFLEAAGRRDASAAMAFVMSEATCQAAPAPKRAECPEFVKKMRESIPRFIEQVPKGFAADQVKPGEGFPGMKGGDDVSFLQVTPRGGGEAIPVFVMQIDGRYYVMLPVKRKEKKG